MARTKDRGLVLSTGNVMPPTIEMDEYRLLVYEALFAPQTFPLLPAAKDSLVVLTRKAVPESIDKKNRSVPGHPNATKRSAT